MKKRKTLEDYLKQELSERAKALGATGYSAWITQHGVAPSLSYAKKSSELDASFAKGIKSRAISLGSPSSSGYADYIGDSARRDLTVQKQAAARAYDEALADGIKSYGKYLDDYSDKYKKLYESTEKKLRSERLTDAERAYERAVELGLTDADARRAANKISAELTESIRGEVMSAIVTKRMTQKQTKLYAVGLGLSEEMADELARYAYELNEQVDGGGYLDYLRELEKKQQKEKK